jgi:hypothetical protein
MNRLPAFARVIALLAALLSGLACNLFRSEPPVQPPTPTLFPNQRPADFTAEYYWAEGSLPPPYHYEYTIAVAADGTVTLTYVPDYPADGVPEWVETVSLSTAELDALYANLATYGLFTTNWQAQGDPPVGGSSDTLSATSGGATIKVPAYVIPEQAADQEALAATLHALIPDDVWANLDAQRDEYVAAHSDQ